MLFVAEQYFFRIVHNEVYPFRFIAYIMHVPYILYKQCALEHSDFSICVSILILSLLNMKSILGVWVRPNYYYFIIRQILNYCSAFSLFLFDLFLIRYFSYSFDSQCKE